MMTSFGLILFIILILFIFVFILFQAPITAGLEVTLLDTSQSDSLRWVTHHEDPDKRGWREASYGSNDGDVVRVYTVCLVASTSVNNWLRTPFIKRHDANRIFVEVRFTMRKCTKYPEPNRLQQCKESFRILHHQSDRDYRPEELPPWDETAYKLVDVIPANKVFTDNSDALINVETRGIPVVKKGVYFAFQDQGACATLLAVRAYYVACPQVVESLAYFEETAAGKDLTSIVQRSGKCVKDAVEGHREPSYLCKGDGKWNFYTGDCVCQPGFQPNDNRTQCKACSPGSFKHEKGNTMCSLCPGNSQSRGLASVLCQCTEGHYRGLDDPYSACRSPPSKVRDLVAKNVSQSSVELSWSRPEDTGDDHVWYSVDCKSCDPSVVYVPGKSDINTTRVLITNLKSSTEYLISIKSENSVTHLSDVIKSRSDVIVETDDAVPPRVTNVHVTSIGSRHISLNWDVPPDVQVDCFEIFMLAKETGSDVTALGNHHHYQQQQQQKTRNNDEEDGDGASERPVAYYHNSHSNDSNADVVDEVGAILAFDSRIKLNLTGSRLAKNSAKNEDDQRTRNENFNLSGRAIITSSKFNNATFTSLEPHTEYFFQVRIRTKKYVGEFSAPISATTGIILHHPAETPLALLVASSVGLLFCTSVGALVVLFITRRNRQLFGNKLNCTGDLSKNSFALGTMQACDSTGVYPVYSHTSSVRTYVDPYTYEDPNMAVSEFTKEIDADFITIESVIGGGEFGDVCKGLLTLPSKPPLTVAIKTLKSGASEKNRLDFLTEASIMGQFDHPNVIYLEGVVTKSNPVTIVTEFMMNGSLDIFLRNNEGQFTMLQLVGMMRGVSSGMKYLAEMGYVHRDLAARNILVSETLICKVSDFGLSREIEQNADNGEYTTRGGKIPVRWTAPEAIAYRKFTTSSDVWSYGVVIWEIVTYGERPYWSWSNNEVIKAVESDFTLPPPGDCPETIHRLMLDCWQRDRLCRPKFSDIVKTLDKLIRSPEQLLHLAQSSSAEVTSFRADVMSMMTKDYETVEDFLRRIKMERYVDLFRSNGIDNLEKVAMLNLRDLMSMGIHLIGHQKKILDNIQTLHCHFID